MHSAAPHLKSMNRVKFSENNASSLGPTDKRQGSSEQLEDGEIAERKEKHGITSSQSSILRSSALPLMTSGPKLDLESEAMTPEEYDRAKSTVLDLLGWGVSPEYLVEHGVSSNAIYQIFTELNLRLPANILSPSRTVSSAENARGETR